MVCPLLTYELWTPHLWDAGPRAAVRRFGRSMCRCVGGTAQRSTGRTPTEVEESVDSTQTSAPRARGTALFAANFTG